MPNAKGRKRAEFEALEQTLRKRANGAAGIPFPTRPHEAETKRELRRALSPATLLPHAAEPVNGDGGADEEC